MRKMVFGDSRFFTCPVPSHTEFAYVVQLGVCLGGRGVKMTFLDP